MFCAVASQKDERTVVVGDPGRPQPGKDYGDQEEMAWLSPVVLSQ
jgi:hypothetical protein